jgi:hypothetical protein
MISLGSIVGSQRWRNNSALSAKKSPPRCVIALIPIPVRAENLNPGVLVMQPANLDIRHDASEPLNQARDRSLRVLRPPGNISEHQPIVGYEKNHSKAEIPDREWIEKAS